MEINILIEENLNSGLEDVWLQNLVERTLLAEKTPPNIEMSLVITGQEKIQELNRNYRNKDSPTDVLSFVMTPDPIIGASPAFVSPPDGILHLGEVLISYPQAIIQSKEHNHSIKKEIAILVIHGVLHLLGYDHEKPDMEKQMKSREQDILSHLEKEPA